MDVDARAVLLLRHICAEALALSSHYNSPSHKTITIARSPPSCSRPRSYTEYNLPRRVVP